MINPNHKKKTLIFESDWIASSPFFYDLKNGLFGKNINNVISNGFDTNFHSEGLKNFLNYGYSVFAQTPIENVKFLSPASRLFQYDDGKLVVEQLDDPVEKWMDYSLSENDIIDLIQERVQTWEANLPSNQEIILPLSGGYDSRLLLWCLRDKSRVRAYTYGLSEHQDQSTEVVHARLLAKHFKLNWQQIFLGEFHNYFDDWDKEFGLSTHAHGMYHFEFYKKIREHLKGEHAFLSGIFGDIWAGSILPTTLKNSNDLINLSYSHGLCANSKFLKLKDDNQLCDNFFFENNEKLSDYRFQVITTIRLKIILISYLIRVPSLFKFTPWAPYLDIDIAMAMLNLPQARRTNRQWQADFFKKVGLDSENNNLRSKKQNNLDFQAMRKKRVKPLNIDLLSNFFEKDYINWINKNVFVTPLANLRSKILSIPKIGGIMRRLGIKNINLEAYYAYLCLKPVEKFLERKK